MTGSVPTTDGRKKQADAVPRPSTSEYENDALVNADCIEDHLDDFRSDVATYCRIGERSSITRFTLHELLGYDDVCNDDGSWIEWGNLIRSPIETEVEDPASRASKG